jgi:hypothetical protein
MNYRTASRQQLLAERARLLNAHSKALQRTEPSSFNVTVGGGNTRRNRGSSQAPRNQAERLAADLAAVEAELKRRDEQPSTAEAPAKPAEKSKSQKPKKETERTAKTPRTPTERRAQNAERKTGR